MTVGYLFSGVITHLPILAVLIAGLIVVGARKARLGRRSATFAQLGLGVLALGQLLEIIWFMLLPEIIGSMDYSSRSYGIMTLIVGIFLAALLAAGLALLVAALVTRAPAGPAGPFEPAQPPFGGPFGAAPTPHQSASGPHQPAPGGHQPAPSGYAGPVSGYQPSSQPPGPDATWSSPGAPGFGAGPPPSGPPAER